MPGHLNDQIRYIASFKLHVPVVYMYMYLNFSVLLVAFLIPVCQSGPQLINQVSALPQLSMQFS